MKAIPMKHAQRSQRPGQTTQSAKRMARAPKTSGDFYALLDNMRTALKQGWSAEILRENLTGLSRVVMAKGKSIKARDEFSYLKSICIMAETYEYLGEIELSKRAVAEGEGVLEQLKKSNATDREDRRVLRERIRLCLDYASIVFYRNYQYDEAKDIVMLCRDFVLLRLKDEGDFPCLGTLARAEYYLGRIHMRKNEYEQAEACFERALHYYDVRADRMKRESKNKQRLLEELIFSEHKAGICLGLGLGWTNFLKGHLKTALRNNIIPARVLMKRTEDALNTAHLDLLFGAVMRSLANRHNKEKLREAIASIKGAYDVFKKYDHRLLMAKAAYELSLAYLYNNELDKAEAALREGEEASEKINDLRWQCQASIVQSRIERGARRYAEAERLASAALESARESNQVLYQIEALITRGEARIMLEKIEQARADFMDALRLNTEPGLEGKQKQANPKLEAACRLHLARSYIRERKVRSAEVQFERWRELREQIEHGIIHEIASDVEREIRDLNRDFVIRADTDDLRYDKHLDALRAFLIERAASKGLTSQQIADELGVSRQSIYTWQKDMARN